MEKIYNQEALDEFLALKTMKPEKLKALLLLNHYGYNTIVTVYKKYEDEDKVCFMSNIYKWTVGRYNNLYIKKTTNSGFTFNKKEKKLNVWKGISIRTFLMLNYFIEFVREVSLCDWFNTDDTRYINTTTLKALLSGKIKKPNDLVSVYLKSKRIKVSPKLFSQSSRTHDIEQPLKYVKNPEYLLKQFLKNGYASLNIWRDTVIQGRILSIDVNGRWGNKRLLEEHRIMTKAINEMLHDKKTSKEPIYTQNVNLTIPYDGKLLKSEQEIYEEGCVMQHCLYNNYFFRIIKGTYIALSCVNGQPFTTGIRYNSTEGKFTLDQIYGYDNTSVSRTIHDIFIEWLKKSDTQQNLLKLIQNMNTNVI